MKTPPRRLDTLRLVSRGAGLAVALIGGSVLLGWALDVGALKSVVPGLVEMKANTAACFVLAGVSLALLGARPARMVSEAFAGVVIAVGLVTIAEYLTGRGVGLDEILFRDPYSLAMGLPPGRMALATALAFVLSGASLVLTARRRSLTAAQYLTLVAVLIPIFSLLAYLFGERAVTMTSPFTSLALNTAFAFAVLGVGILGECSEVGPMSVFVARGPGGTSLRGLLPLSLVTTLALGFAAFLGARAGLYSHALGMVLFAVVTSVVLSAAIWVNAWLLNRTEAARRREGEWLQLTLRSIGDAVIATDREGRVQFLNPVAEGLTGWASGEATGHALGDVFRIVNEATRRVVENPVAEVLREGNVVGLANHTVLIAKDGSERPIEDSASPIKDERGEISGVVLVFQDVTSRKRAEAEVRSKSERLNLLVENIRDYAVVVTDPEGTITEWQGGAERITGFAASEAVGRKSDLIFTPEDRAAGRPQQELKKAAEAGRSEDRRWHLRKDGSRFYGDGVTTSLLDEGGRLRGFGKVFKDATGEMRATEATRRRAAQLQKLAEISSRINAAHDVDSVVGVVTEEARTLIGARQAATSMVLDPSYPQPVNVVATATSRTGQPVSADMDGTRLYEAVREEHRPIRLAQEALETDPRWKTFQEVALAIPSGNGWLAVPLVGRNGKSIGLLQLADKEDGEFSEDDEAILVQLSRLAAIAIENARLYQELRSNDERKDEFLAMLAHELRNPLAAIGNAVKLSSQTDLKEHIDWSMGVITRQMQHLSRLIDDLMDVSRITRGKIELRRDVMDVTPVLESAAATVRTLVEERKHTLDLAVDRGGLWADVDPTRLEQVVVNLLNNAAKYSENGGHIRLSARVEAEEVVIGVRDRGVGIRPEKLPEMFELFAQGDRSLARSEGGLGIGLTVVKKLVEMHGGSVTARSEGPGMGSEFTLRLPAARRPSGERPRERGPAKEPVKKARILVVDDNVDTARGMARLLKLFGHEVATAHNGPEGIEVAKEFGPDYVLLDIGLPGMNGYEVASQLRREECCKDALIVAVSGYGQDEDRRRSKDAGFDHHLTKPLDHDALLSLITAGGNGRA